MLKKQWSPVLVTKLSSGRIVALAIDEEKSRGLTRVNFPDVACNWRMYEVRPSKPDVGKIHKVSQTITRLPLITKHHHISQSCATILFSPDSPDSSEMAFNVDHLLNTNSTPSEEQRNSLQNAILQLDEDILNTDEDISDINEQILVLQSKRAQLVQQRRRYSSLFSPVRCLPIEIFGIIFVYATRGRPRHVLNISAVCRLWRNAALHTPVLWSTLVLGHHMTRSNITDHIDSWIERADSYPLSLVIIKQDNSLDPVFSVLALITEHRWKSITLDSDDHTIILILNDFEFSDLEMFESLSLGPRFSFRYLPENALRYVPKLRTLSLKTVLPVSFDMLPYPWRQLTSLTMFWNNGIGPDILQACVNLEEFVVDGDGYAGEQLRGDTLVLGLNDSRVTLNNLRKLHVYCFYKMFHVSLKTPSIRDFTLVTGASSLYSDFYCYIDTFGSTLLKLSISPYQPRLVESFPYLRSLVELRLYDDNYDEDYEWNVTSKVLGSLVVNPEMVPSAIPLPRLETLEIICLTTENNQKLFMKVIGSRWWSDEEEKAKQRQGWQSLSRIKRSVFMNVHTELDMFCRDDVDVFRAQGMNIEYLAPFDGMDEDDFYASRSS